MFALADKPSVFISFCLGMTFTFYGILNGLQNLGKKRTEMMLDISREMNPNLKFPELHFSARQTDHPLECFMPPVEVDKVARAYAYLAGKGRTLVREAKAK